MEIIKTFDAEIEARTRANLDEHRAQIETMWGSLPWLQRVRVNGAEWKEKTFSVVKAGALDQMAALKQIHRVSQESLDGHLDDIICDTIPSGLSTLHTSAASGSWWLMAWFYRYIAVGAISYCTEVDVSVLGLSLLIRLLILNMLSVPHALCLCGIFLGTYIYNLNPWTSTTEENRVNCPFYFKIGACGHGGRCSRLHTKPVSSQTVLIQHMYQNPASQLIAQQGEIWTLDHKKVNQEFEEFFEEVFGELSGYGEIEEMHVCENLGGHLVGNVYVKYYDEEEAKACQKALNGRFYAGRPLTAEFSPVTDFREARCCQFDKENCGRGGYCNFLHIKKIIDDAEELHSSARLFICTYNTANVAVSKVAWVREVPRSCAIHTVQNQN
jgi:splicing factor U2AF subunit